MYNFMISNLQILDKKLRLDKFQDTLFELRFYLGKLHYFIWSNMPTTARNDKFICITGMVVFHI